MKLVPLLLAAPVVLQTVAADPRPTAALDARHAIDRWQFPRQASTGAGSATATNGGGATQTERETTSQSPTTRAATSAAPATSASPTTEAQQSRTTETQANTQASQTQNQETTTQTPTQATTQQTNGQQTATQSQAASSTAEVPLSTPSPIQSQLVTTNSAGQAFTSVVVITQSAVPAAETSSPAKDESKGLSTSTIIGLSVTGGIAVLLVILLIVWKFTNKRFSDLEDTGDDAIKWPELNKDSAAMTPLPARPTGRAGVDDDFDRQSTAANSTADLTGTHYQPYSDDPGYGARPAYYDPYGGAPGAVKPYASPPGSHDGEHKNWGGAADGQYYDAPRGPSPGPNLAYADSIGRGTSPGPNLAYGDAMGRGTSPAPPNVGYADPTGRTASPAPTYGYGAGYAPEQVVGGDPYGGRHSPGPNLAYGGQNDTYGRRSPGPGLAYSGAVGRVGSPGPGVAPGGYR